MRNLRKLRTVLAACAPVAVIAAFLLLVRLYNAVKPTVLYGMEAKVPESPVLTVVEYGYKNDQLLFAVFNVTRSNAVLRANRSFGTGIIAGNIRSVEKFELSLPSGEVRDLLHSKNRIVYEISDGATREAQIDCSKNEITDYMKNEKGGYSLDGLLNYLKQQHANTPNRP